MELLEIESENVHLNERYMIGGVKTEAGKNRVIPIHESIVPLIEYRLSQNRKYLITNKYKKIPKVQYFGDPFFSISTRPARASR